MAAKLILTPYDFNKNEIRNFLLHLLGTDPGTPSEGQIWWNTTGHVPKVYNGTTVLDLTNPLLLNGQSGAYYLARANHTGTQLAATISDFDSQVRTSRLDQMALPTASVNLNSQKITNLADGTSANDAVNFSQLVAQIQGFAWKNSVRAASTGNINLAAPGAAIDGVTMVATNRFLAKDQTTSADKGIYIFNGAAVPATRATDMDGGNEAQNATVLVDEGTANSGTAWNQTTDAVTIGTTGQTWVQFGTGASYTFSTPMLLTGNNVTLQLNARLVNNAGFLDLQASVVTPGSYTLCTVDTYGRVTAGADIVASAGIVVKTAAGTFTARTITGTAARITVTNGDGVAGVPTIDIASTYVGQASIVTVGTITTGVWTGTTIAVANGGTGATTAAAARTNLGATGKYSALIGTGAATAITITQATHGLANTSQNLVQLFDATTGAEVDCDIVVAPASGNVTFNFSVAPASNAYRAVIIG